jgi:hypothetical protein
MADEDEIAALVIDNGSGMCKGGYQLRQLYCLDLVGLLPSRRRGWIIRAGALEFCRISSDDRRPTESAVQASEKIYELLSPGLLEPQIGIDRMGFMRQFTGGGTSLPYFAS